MVTRADLARQAVDMSKATFDNVYLTVTALQKMAEDALVEAAVTSSWVPREVGALVRECAGLAERTRRDLKGTADRCHALLHALIDRTLPDERGAEADQGGAAGRSRTFGQRAA